MESILLIIADRQEWISSLRSADLKISQALFKSGNRLMFSNPTENQTSKKTVSLKKNSFIFTQIYTTFFFLNLKKTITPK